MQNIEITLPGAQDMAETLKAGFIECMYWADTGEEDQPDTDAELSQEASQQIAGYCLGYLVKAAQALGADFLESIDLGQAGHSLYLDMAGHGAGARDGGLGWSDAAGDTLADIAQALADPVRGIGTLEVYQGDDGLIYFC